MYANYQTVDFATRVALGNNAASAYGPSVLADFVGLLTGSITTVNQLSAYADKTTASIQGAAGDWVVYDADAHSSLSGAAKVLRRLCVDTLNYQYLFLAFRVGVTADVISGVYGVMGGWNALTKAPTTPMRLSDGSQILAGVVVSSTNLPLTMSPVSAGGNTTHHWNTETSGTYGSVPYKILSSPALLAIWPEPVAGTSTFPMLLLAEYASMNPWSNSASACTPIVYGCANSNNASLTTYAPFMKNVVGNAVTPAYTNLSSVAGNTSDSGAQLSDFSAPSGALYDYARNATGNKVIPVLPIDVTLRITSSGYFCYAGRLRELFATLPGLATSDTFTVGAATYVVIPVGFYNQSLASYSPNGKLCAKIQ